MNVRKREGVLMQPLFAYTDKEALYRLVKGKCCKCVMLLHTAMNRSRGFSVIAFLGFPIPTSFRIIWRI